MKTKNILFLLPYPLHVAPSQRFRVEQFFPLLKKSAIEVGIQSFIDEKTWKILYHNSSNFKKGIGVLKGFLRRIKMLLFSIHKYDFVFIHREASPIGPPFIEFIIAKIWKKKIIYDFDDALWITDPSGQNNLINWVKANWKIKYLCKWSYKVVGGNDYLCDYARQFCKNIYLIPTCVDTENRHNQINNQDNGIVRIGWTGSHSTLKYLENIVPVLEQLIKEMKVELVVISNLLPSFQIPNMEFIKWNEETEIEDLLKIDIGLMPLENDPWCEGKCGFKLIQYLSLGIPAVASPVGVNKKIIEQDKNGFLCETAEEWKDCLEKLILDARLRKKMGQAGREKIIQQYSVQAHAQLFSSLFLD